MTNAYKILTFILLFIVIAETGFIVWAYNTGNESMNNEIKCSNEVCFNEGSSSYTYDDYSKTCSCYNEYVEVIHQEVLG